MIYIFITLLSFLSFVILHIFSHKILAIVGKATFKSILVMPISIIVFSFITIYRLPQMLDNGKSWWTVPIPVNAIILYGIFTAIYLIYFTNAYYGESSPTGKIYEILKEKGKATFKQIVDEFSDEDLIGKRLDNLVTGGLIRKKGKIYYLTLKSQKVMKAFDVYRRLLGWDRGG